MNAPLDDRLGHEINNALMIILSFAEAIDRRSGSDPVVHDAVGKIQDAVDRSRVIVCQTRQELGEIAGRLSRA